MREWLDNHRPRITRSDWHCKQRADITRRSAITCDDFINHTDAGDRNIRAGVLHSELVAERRTGGVSDTCGLRSEISTTVTAQETRNQLRDRALRLRAIDVRLAVVSICDRLIGFANI